MEHLPIKKLILYELYAAMGFEPTPSLVPIGSDVQTSVLKSLSCPVSQTASQAMMKTEGRKVHNGGAAEEDDENKKKEKKKKLQIKAEEEVVAYDNVGNDHGLGPIMEKKKRKNHKANASARGHDDAQDEAPARELERKKEPEGPEPLTRKKRKRDKTGASSKQEAEVAEELTCTASCMPMSEEQHSVSGFKKRSRQLGLAQNLDDHFLLHGVGMLLETHEKKEKKEKKKRKNEGEHCSSFPDRAVGPRHLSDEEDMLFNFSAQPKAMIVENTSPQLNSVSGEQTMETLLAKDELSKRTRRKRKSGKGEDKSACLKRDKELTLRTDANEAVQNLAIQPQPADERMDNDKSPVPASNLNANGSFQEEKYQKDLFICHKHMKEKEKKTLTLADKKTREKSEQNRSPRNLSESPSRPTFSIAVAGSIVDNAQSLELATMLAGQIARAAAIFRVDEIVVFDDYDGSNHQAALQDGNSEEVGGLFMVRILKYLEVPQYLRRALIPMHRSLSSVGKLPPLDAPHHLRKHEWRPFREGVVLNKSSLSGSGSCVDVGLEKEVVVDQKLDQGTRVTVAMGQNKSDGNVLQVVNCETPRQAGFYWGYSVRYASCLSAVFHECPYEGNYDFCIGTSEHGEKLAPTDLVLPKCRHLLVAFGGLSGLEESVELDKGLRKRNVTSLFNRYINTCSNQGSRTIRTEEAILISLQFLQAAVQQALSAL